MTSAYLTPYHGTDFTLLCDSTAGKRNWVSIAAIATFFLFSEGISVASAIHFYPKLAPVLMSVVFGAIILFLCGWAFYKQVTQTSEIPFKRVQV